MLEKRCAVVEVPVVVVVKYNFVYHQQKTGYHFSSRIFFLFVKIKSIVALKEHDRLDHNVIILHQQ
jgi:hypothetical protein